MCTSTIVYYIGILILTIYFIELSVLVLFSSKMKVIPYYNAYIGNIINLIILLIIWYHIFLVIRMKMNIIIKGIMVCIIFLFPFFLFYPILSIYNLILLLYYNNKPFIKNINNIFPENEELEQNYKSVYKKELDRIYEEYQKVDCIANNNPGFRIGDKKEKCWRAIYIKILNEFKITNFDKKYPHLHKILKKPYISNAFLSILDENVDIPEHYGYFKGYYRYHLGYIIPEFKGKKPFIVCGNEKYEWQEGKGVLFDDMYLHYVRNDTPYKRIVLYLDIIRPELRNNIINDIVLYLLSKNAFVQKLDKSQHKQTKLSSS